MDQIATYEFFIAQGFSKERAKAETQRLAGGSVEKPKVSKTEQKLAQMGASSRAVYHSLVGLGGSSSIDAIWKNFEAKDGSVNDPSKSTIIYHLRRLRAYDLVENTQWGVWNVL